MSRMYAGSYTIDREKSEEIQRRVSSLLEEDYDELKKFFMSFFESEYDYIVMMSRRCMVLYQLFILIDRELTDSERVISNHAIPYYRDSMRGKKVVIVDDILIHGRTVSAVHDLLSRYCGEECKPDIRVYMASTKMDCVDYDIKRKIQSSCVAYAGEWRSLSNKIVNAIISSNIPYTSFVESFFYSSQSAFWNQIDKAGTISVDDNTDFLQEQCGIKAFYCHETDNNRENIFCSLSLKECIRIYRNEYSQDFTVIPYVFTKALDIQNAQQIFEKIGQSMPDSMPAVRNVLCRKISDVEKDIEIVEYKMRLLTCILSNLYFRQFCDKYQLLQGQYRHLDTLAKSFGSEISEEIERLFEADVSALLEYAPDENHISMVDIGTDTDDDLKEKLKTVLSEDINKSKDRNILKHYFQKAWHEDERRAESFENRVCGLTLETFQTAAIENQIADDEIFRDLISSWDTGIATANCLTSLKNKFVGCYNSPGEQSYRIILEKYPFVISSLIFVSKNIKYSGKNTKEEFEKERICQLQKLLKKFDAKYSLNDYSDIIDIIKRERGYLGSWNQSEILQSALPYDSINDEKIVMDFMEENL